MEAGSELGFHRGGFSGMDFNSLMVVDMWKLTVWVREKAARRQSDHRAVHVVPFRVTRFSRGRSLIFPGIRLQLVVSVTGCLRPQIGPFLEVSVKI